MRAKILWLLFLLLSFVVTLPVTWLGLSKVDFFYASLHDNIGIDKHIERYAPRNRFNKKDFEKTSKQQRVTLFHGVVEAIHNDGVGLEALFYLNSNQQKTTLFTDAEVIHLKDVAILLNKLKPVLIVVFAIWLMSLLWLFWKRIKLPTALQLSILSMVWVVIAVLILLLGPEKVFNQLHVWVFPKDHQWFFYYEESLMSTMMKAPYLFAYISAIWALLSIISTIILFKLMHLFLRIRR